jgi:hypothetical protein
MDVNGRGADKIALMQTSYSYHFECRHSPFRSWCHPGRRFGKYRFTPSPVIPVNLPSSNPRQKGGSISVPQRVLTTSGAVPLPFSDGREVKVQLSALCWLTWRYKMRHPRLVVCGVFLPINPLFVMPQLSSLLFLAALSRGVSAAIGPNATLPIVNANISPDGFCRA